METLPSMDLAPNETLLSMDLAGIALRLLQGLELGLRLGCG